MHVSAKSASSCPEPANVIIDDVGEDEPENAMPEEASGSLDETVQVVLDLPISLIRDYDSVVERGRYLSREVALRSALTKALRSDADTCRDGRNEPRRNGAPGPSAMRPEMKNAITGAEALESVREAEVAAGPGVRLEERRRRE